jgi:hypothetical protein
MILVILSVWRETIHIRNVNHKYPTFHAGRQANQQMKAEASVLCELKLHGLSPRANYTYRATAFCRQSYCQLFEDRGCHVVSVSDPYGCILGFLDRSRYFSIK